MDEKLKQIDINTGTSFTDIIDIVYITPEDSCFSLTKNGFLTLVSKHDVKPEKLFDDEKENGEAKGPEEKKIPPFPHHGHTRGHGRKAPPEIKYTPDGRRDYGRVILHRAFPFDKPGNIISVQQEDGFEIGIIRDISEFDKETQDIINQTLDKKYFVPEIKKILSAKDKFGFVYFKCETDKGVCEFVVRNPFGSIIRVSDTRIFIVDIDSNRYSVRDVSALDRASYKKIELYI